VFMENKLLPGVRGRFLSVCSCNFEYVEQNTPNPILTHTRPKSPSFAVYLHISSLAGESAILRLDVGFDRMCNHGLAFF